MFQRQSLRALTGFDDFAFEKLGNTISASADFVGASLGVKPDQVKAWITGTPSLDIADLVNLDSLSRLYAAASLCRALRIAPDALPDIVALLGTAADPFHTLLPVATTAEELAQQARVRALAMLEFVERITFVRKSGFDFETLSYLLRHRVLPGKGSDASIRVEQQLTQTLTELRSALQSGVVVSNVSADHVKHQLARLAWYPALIDGAMGSEGLNYQPSASVDISPPLSPEPVIPPNLRAKFIYRQIETAKAVLECAGSLIDSDFANLIGTNLFSAAQVTALQSQYNTQLDEHARTLAALMRAFELPKFEKAVDLTVSPIIPGDFKDRLRFETKALGGKLTLTGWLSNSEKKTVSDANQSNPVFSAALNILQRTSMQYVAKPTEQFIASTDAEQLLREPNVEERYRTILLRLVSRLDLDLLLTQLSVSLGLDQQVFGRLLDAAKMNARSAKDLLTDSDFLRSDSKSLVERTSWPNQFAALELLSKIATIGIPLAIAPEQWDWVLSKGFTVMDVLALPTSTATPASFDGWRKLVDLFHLRDVLPDGSVRLVEIETALKASDFDTVRKQFADAFELGSTEVVDACSTALLAFTEKDYNNPSRLLELAQLLHVTKSLGTTSSSIKLLIQPAPTGSDAQLARTLFAAGINASEFPERLRPISNRLRTLQRNALVAYLIHRDHLADSNELFDHYLIDVEMGSCMLTSRIKQAISSVQLFVQRCLLNLEQATDSAPGVSPASINTQRWQWMKYYRVWEANRKVFLYPENWIEPELRDDKTEIFKAFESDLLQREITHDTALLAFRKYADGLGDVARLTVVSMFDEKDGVDTLVHIVARDNSQPYKHYYRQWRLGPTNVYGNWTSWEEISTQVDSEHVVVFVHAGNVHLAWPTITKKQTEVSWAVRMNLARRTAAGWTKLKKGRGELSCSMVPNKDEANSLAFRFSQNPPSIECFGPMDKWVTPRSPDSQFTQFEATKFISVPGKDQNEPAHQEENLAERNLDLRVRVLRKYTDLRGAVFFDAAKPSIAKVTASIWSMWRFSPSGVIFPILVQRELRPPNEGPSHGSFSFVKDMWDLDPLKNLRFPDLSVLSPTLHSQIMIGLRASITSTSGVIYKKQELRSEFKTLEKDAAWNIDFIFEIDESNISDDHPELGANRPLSLSKIGSFLLKDDDSFDLLKAQAGRALESPPMQGAEHYSSGYRESPHTGDHPLTVEGAQIFSGTPGLFFTCRTAQQPGKNFWAYHDDAVDLVLWRESSSQQYRLVPMGVTGTTELRRALAMADLDSAVQLPEKLTKPLIAATNVDADSIRESSIGFEKLPSSNYYWEVFFHNPLLIATQLSQAQRFEEAQRWFHLIFDPTTNDNESESFRYWRFLPFREKGNSIDELLQNLAQGKDLAPPKFTLKNAIEEWAENPFRPHLVAKHRLRSYQFAVVQKYLENLIAWGDQLFRRDTIEAINEATQLYVLAAKILGKRPASSPKTEARPKSYRDIYRKLDDLSNAWEPLVAITATQSSSSFMKRHDRSDQPSIDVLNSLRSLYFCIPSNEKLSEYWDTVGDRLFKIRHCMNIEGIERQLPLFEPPIDPALLVRATAAGLDIAAVLSDLQAPLPLYRFSVMVQKALELCGEVKALGNALLSALEKKDAEQLSLLRSSHEIQMLKLMRAIKLQQQEEAEANLEALRKTREITLQRYLNYQRLMGKQNIVVPAEGAPAALESSSLQLATPGAGGGNTQGLGLIAAETGQLGWLNDANNFSIVAGIFNTMGGVAHAIPEVTFSAPTTSFTFGGTHIGNALNSVGSVFSILSSNASFQANRSSIMGGHQRRYDEWQFQSNTAAKELEQIDKQILANEIRIQIAVHEITNHDQQLENTQEVDEFMRDKFTSQQLYSWMVGQISKVYFRTYQLAHDIAKRTERTYRFELGLKEKDSRFIEFGYWDSLKKGLLSGERLSLDLKRMEVAYLEQNKREYEITKHVSLMQLDPEELLRLKETGKCEVSIQEALLDMDFPGHYLRRIKSVSLTIPCVTGPYSTVPCTLRLLKHSVRHSNNASANYARDIENDDPRFTDTFGGIQIVTSSGQNDSGLFETNLRDDRYLPFEGAGAISTWGIELPSEFRQFDYGTISDVILHLRYIAREGGERLKTGAVNSIDGLVKNAEAAGSVRVFSVRHEFPTEWAKFQGQTPGTNQRFELKVNLRPEHYPFWSQGRLNKVVRVKILVRSTENPVPGTMHIFDSANTTHHTKKGTLTKNAAPGALLGGLLSAGLPAKPDGALQLFFDTKALADLWIAVTWGA